MSQGPWAYPEELRAALGGLGLSPTADTPPALVREAVGDLYRVELRRVRDRLLAQAIPKTEYLGHVIALRKKYWMLTLPPPAWERICRSQDTEIT
jgi:hypothetical protein